MGVDQRSSQETEPYSIVIDFLHFTSVANRYEIYQYWDLNLIHFQNQVTTKQFIKCNNVWSFCWEDHIGTD